MTNTKFNANVRIDRLMFPTELSLDEQIVAAIEARNIPVIDFDVDENGNIFADPNKDPIVYDWAVNG